MAGKKRVRFVTKGRTLEKEDARKSIVREPERGNVPPSGPVDYERLWKNIRLDSSIFWDEFLKIAERLCPACKKEFTETLQSAQRKAFGSGGKE